MALSLNFANIDVSTPLNRIMGAYATKIEAEAEAVNPTQTNSKVSLEYIEILESKIEVLNARLKVVESVAHAPNSRKLIVAPE